MEPNRKLFCDHLPFIHYGVLVGQGSLCGPFMPQLKTDDFCNAKGSEVYMAYMFILMLLSLCASLGQRWIFKKIHHVPKGFSSSQMCSPRFLNSTQVLSHMVCPKFNSPVYKLKWWNLRDYISFYFAIGVHRGASFIGGMPNVPKKLLMGWINMAKGLKVL